MNELRGREEQLISLRRRKISRAWPRDLPAREHFLIVASFNHSHHDSPPAPRRCFSPQGMTLLRSFT
jgi:hypothetical protein